METRNAAFEQATLGVTPTAPPTSRLSDVLALAVLALGLCLWTGLGVALLRLVF